MLIFNEINQLVWIIHVSSSHIAMHSENLHILMKDPVKPIIKKKN